MREREKERRKLFVPNVHNPLPSQEKDKFKHFRKEECSINKL